MIILLSASAIYLAALQAGINAPRSAFTACIKSSTAEAQAAKVPGEGIETYLRTHCSSQIDSFKAASVDFDVKNGISRKSAQSSADDMISGWLESSIESYKYKMEALSPKPQQAKAAAADPAAAQKASSPQSQ